MARNKNKDLQKDLRNIIEHVTASIVKNEREEEFYRRSAEATTREDVKKIMLEIAGNIAQCRLRLEAQREKMMKTLADLEAEAG